MFEALQTNLHLTQYSLSSLSFLVASAFIAGVVRGISGFGASLIFTPVASISLGPHLAAPLLLLIDSIASLGLIPNAWRRANKREVAAMAIGALFGAPLGAWVLTHTDSVTVRWMIVVAATPMLILLISGWRYHGSPKNALTVGTGTLSGFFSGLAQLGAPPIVLYWLGGKNVPASVRANVILFFVATAIFSGISYKIAGLFTTELFDLAVLTLPSYILALWIGTKMFGLADEQTFRRICYALIAAAILISLPVLDGVIR